MTHANILIVEDERIVAKDIEERLRELGYKVAGIASTGEKAIEKSEAMHPDLVLMDIKLKGDMDGIHTAETIKNRFNIPVIYLTAFADEATLERAKVTEPFGYILKPFNERDLRSTVEMALYKHAMEKRLKHSQEMKVLGQLAAGVAHEVRNPLNAILAITEALFQDIGDNKEYQPYLEHIRTQVNRLSDLMKDLLELGRPIKSSYLRKELLGGVCASTLNLWKQMALSEHHEVQLISQIEPDEVSVNIDSPKLQQVFLNLLENAAHQSPKESTIIFTILSPVADAVKIHISDSGVGIPTDKLGMVFEPFFTDRRGGVGLGLSIVKHFVESMGGSVRIWNNDPPPGCTAEVILPVGGKEKD
ncbi:MAG: hypothetical protein C0392_13790 [Syntrophus sp. (in: bacteria)]|nr:hypothetical protein [Syntrophus sp. (in: bacteria)]